MALDAVINVKGILAFTMTGTAGLAFFHVSHGCLGCTNAVGEKLGVAVFAFVCLQVEFMAEGGFTGRFWNHVAEFARFQALVTFCTVTG